MTTLYDASWLSPAAYRALVDAPPLALVASEGGDIVIDKLGRRWDRRKHPRGRDGRFIEVGGLVKFFGAWQGGSVAGTGTVERIDGDNIYVRVAHLNNPSRDGSTYPLNGLTKLNKRQIATVPQGEVRLDRNGNVHPHDRELPDKDGKLLRRGDRVKVGNDAGHIVLVGEDGRVAVRRDSDGKVSARRVEHVERIDAPAAAAKPAPARLDRPATPAPAAPAAPAVPDQTLEERAADFARSFREQVREMDLGRYSANDLRPGGMLNDRLQQALDQESGDRVNVKIPAGSEISIPRDIAEGIQSGRLRDLEALDRKHPPGRREAPQRPAARIDNPTPRPAKPAAPSGADAHGNVVPDGWTKDGNGHYTKDGYDVRLAGAGARKKYDIYHDGQKIDSAESWTGNANAFPLRDVESIVKADQEHRGRVARQNQAQVQPSRWDVADALDHFGFSTETKDAVVHGSSDEAKAAIQADPAYQRMRDEVAPDREADFPRGNRREAIQHADKVEAAIQHGVGGEPRARLDTPAAPAKSEVRNPTPRSALLPEQRQAPARPRFEVNEDTPEEDVNGQEVPDGWSLKEPDNSEGRQVYGNEHGYEIHVGDDYEVYDPSGEHLGDFRRFDTAEMAADDHNEHRSETPKTRIPEPAPAAPSTPHASPAVPDAPSAPQDVILQDRGGLPLGLHVNVAPPEGGNHSYFVEHSPMHPADGYRVIVQRPGRHGHVETVRRVGRASSRNGAVTLVRRDLGVSDAPDVPEYERQLRAATDATQVDALEKRIENDPHLSESQKYHLAGVVNEMRDNGPANAERGPKPNAPEAPAAPAAPDAGHIEIDPDDVLVPVPGAPAGAHRDNYEARLRAANNQRQIDILAAEIEQNGALSEADKHHLAGVVNELRDNGVGFGRKPVPAPIGQHDDNIPADIFGRVPRVQPGVRGQGRFRDIIQHNVYGDELRLGMVIRTPDGHLGHVTRMSPNSNRVVIKNADGLEIMRSVNRVRTVFHGEGNEDFVWRDRFIRPVRPRPGNARRAPQRGILHRDGMPAREQLVDPNARVPADRAAPQRRLPNRPARDLPQPAPPAPPAAPQVAVNGAFPRVFTPNGQAGLRAIQQRIPRRHDNNPGARDYANAGLALGDAVDTNRPMDERQRAVGRAAFLFDRAARAGHPNARAMGDALGLVNRPAAPESNPVAPVAPQHVPDPDFPRLDEPRPAHPNALNPDATTQDFEQTWGSERGADIARAARERPSLDAVRTANDHRERLALARAVFDGQYGSAGLTFHVDSVYETHNGFGIEGSIIKNGRSVGVFERSVGREGVYNALFKIRGNEQAGGAATEFNRHMENWYIANGIPQVSVSAAGGGGYIGGFVWARNGFDWASSKRSVQNIAADIRAEAVRQRNPAAIREADALIARIDTHDVTDLEFPTPYDLSNVGWKPGMGRDDVWAGKSVMKNTSWGGVKRLDPNAKTYKQQVALGNVPDPSVIKPSGQYDASHVPDELRAMSVSDIRDAIAAGPNRVGTIGDFTVTRAGDRANAPEGAGAGINDTYFLTDTRTGRRFIMKRDTTPSSIMAEVRVSEMLRGSNYYGAAYVEKHPLDNKTMISTFVGEQHANTSYHLVNDERRSGDQIVRGMANPYELLHARLVNAVIGNTDRHGGNAFLSTDADGKTHLLLFDHGFTLADHVMSRSVYPSRNQLIAYQEPLQSMLRQLDSADTLSELETMARSLLVALEGSGSWGGSDELKAGTIARLQEIIADPQKFINEITR